MLLVAAQVCLPTALRAAGQVPPAATVVIFAAASLTDALQELGDDFTKSSGIVVKFSFAASSALARQIESGAPADVFVSADTEWMDYLQMRNRIRPDSRHDLLGNRLVLVAPADSPLELTIGPQFALVDALGKGRLATGDPDSVPVGRYARQALESLGVWSAVEPHLVRAENVRAALAFVDRGEAPLGIVYETDALLDKRVRVVDTFPAESHTAITYPIAVTAGAKPGAIKFVEFARSGTADAVFVKYGFAPLH